MAYAVQECFYSVEKILHSLVDGEGRLWVERIFREINHSISEGSLLVTLSLKKLPSGVQKLTALTVLLYFRRGCMQRLGELAIVLGGSSYTRTRHAFTQFGEQLDTWNILARARNEGRLFSTIECSTDPELKNTFFLSRTVLQIFQRISKLGEDYNYFLIHCLWICHLQSQRDCSL